MKSLFKSRFFSFKGIDLPKQMFHLSFLLSILFSFNLLAQTFPPGFSQVKVGTLYYPTSMAFAPDGRMFCTEKAGRVKIVKNGVVLSTPFLTISVDQLNERGLSSIAIDPNFNTNNYVYIYYTTASSPVHNRLSRFTANGDVAVAGSEHIIFDFDPQINSIHNAGGMVFGSDGTLYLAVGNDNINSNSQDLNSYKGKVLRINTDWSVPAGNPFTGSESAKRIWSYGLRNPWSIAIQPTTGKIFVNDVGEASWEEINDATIGGRNFGWPNAEGMSNNAAYTNPVYTYPHGSTGSNDGCAITGGDFFNPTSTNFPQSYTGKYFFIDYCNTWINYLDLSSSVTKNNFASNIPGAGNYIKTGPDGNLYYFSISQDALYKIIYSSNTAPVIVSQPVNTSVSLSQNATFNVTATGAAPLAYQWQKNNVNIPGANASSYLISNAQNTDAGSYRVIVSNNFGSVTSNSASLTVTAFNTNPVAKILSPSSTDLYRGGDIISFSGSGTDAEDGTLPAANSQWIIEFHHDTHYHPGPAIPAGVNTGSFEVTRTGEKSAHVYFHIMLVVADSKGATDTAFIDLHPKTSIITLLTKPPGLKLLCNDQPALTSFSVEVVSGTYQGLGIIAHQIFNDSNYVFDKWLNGGNATQTITATDNDQTFTAVFKTEDIPQALKEYGVVSNEFISVYPNPSNGLFTFDIPIDESPEELLSINVMNSKGQLVYTKPPTKVGGRVKETVELENNLPSGIYFMQLKLGDKSRISRVILMGGR